MADTMWASMVATLRDNGVEFATGLADNEIETTQRQYGIRFPPDLRAFLQAGLPRGSGFPDWRDGDAGELSAWLDLPSRGVLFDVQHNNFWLNEWEPRPPSPEQSLRVASELLAAAPRLVPIYRHRMMPSQPCVAGNPVLSVHQTDIMYYGVDLRDYFIHEFLTREDIGSWPIPSHVRRVPFWDIEQYLQVRWSGGPCAFDNSCDELP